MASILQDSNTFAHQTHDAASNAGRRTFQQFTPSESYLLTSFRLYHVRYNSDPSGSLRGSLCLADGPGGTPGTIIESVDIPNSTFNEGELAWVEFVLTTPYLVEAGTLYGIQATVVGTTQFDYISRNINNTYTEGIYLYMNGVDWLTPDGDLNFEIWGEVPGPEALPEYRIPVLQDFNWQPPVTGIQNDPPA